VLAVDTLGEFLRSWPILALPVILAIAFLSGRLLGVRRSWTTTVVAGVVGWVAGAALTLSIARSEGDGGFTRNLLLFSTFFAMSATAWIELLAKPGAMARARTGLRRIPRPIKRLRLRSRRVRRYAHITRVAARNGLAPWLGLGGSEADDEVGDGDGDPPARKAPPAVRLRRALEECGGVFVKLGQVASTRSDVLPADVVAELSRLQDRVAAAPRDAVAALLEAELEQPVDAVFADFDWDPVAAASIGQVYRARLRSGDDVIVKVQRPGIDESVERDIDVLLELARTAEARTSWARTYGVLPLAQEFAARLREELDYRIEARHAAQIAACLPADGSPNARMIVIPVVHTELTTSRVMVMQRLDGVSVRDSEAIDALGVDRHALADVLLRSMLTQSLVDGHFHGDPHPGNVMVLPDGTIGLIDFGNAGRLDPAQQSSLREMMVAVALRDPNLLSQAVTEVAEVRRGFDDEQFERALARFMGRHLGPGSSPSAAMFNDLLQLLFSFGIVLPPEFSTFFRALVTLEGTLIVLCPGFLVIAEAQVIAQEWTGDRSKPDTLQDMATQELIQMAPVLRRLPRHLDRLATITERGDLRAQVSLLGDPADVRVVTRLLNRVIVAFLGGVVSLVSVILLGIEGGPPFSGSTSLYTFFGYFGLFCGTVLVLRVLVAVFNDGLN
jgi:ubiquinone biosynthesis protein